MRNDLKSRRRTLQTRLRELSGELAIVPPDPAQAHTAELEIASIYAALRRMDLGEYGVCVSCGGEIASARLDAYPFTVHCEDCARAR